MSGSFRVKFRTGRDRNDSEARSSSGIPQYQSNDSLYYCPRRWDVDSLHRKMGFLTRGLKRSDSDFEIQDLLADADNVIDAFLAYYDSSDIIREDAADLRAVLDERHPRLVQGSTYESRFWLKDLIRSLDHAGDRHAKTRSAHGTPHDSPRPVSSARSTDAKPRTPTFGR